MQDRDFLDKLNAEQKQAVEQIFGTVLVVAGPGTGKTQMLTSRIANILKETDTNPSNILCLTFTENATTQMRNRLQRILKSDKEAYSVRICTFHGFCEWVMGEYPDLFWDLRQKREIADDLQKAEIYRQVIEGQHWQYFKPFGDTYRWQRDFLSTVSKLKREYYTPDKLRDLIPEEEKHLLDDEGNFYQRDTKYGKKGEFKKGKKEDIEKKIGRMQELCTLWEAYEVALSQADLYDFDDQIAWVVNQVAQDENLKSDLQERFQYILVDEYQDTNSAQNQILWHLCDFFENPNLFAVGDDDQSIYRFQGASIENILEFKTHFPQSQSITLSRNYRSSQEILDAATAVVRNNLERVDQEKTLTAEGANASTRGNIQRATFGSRISEIIFIADQIRHHLGQGTPASEIAILVRENREVKELASYLQKLGIPVSTRISEDIFSDQKLRFLLLLLQVFCNPTQDQEFLHLLHAPFWDISSEDLLELTLRTEGGRRNIANVLQEFSKENASFRNIWELLHHGRKNHLHSTPLAITEHLFHASGMAAHLLRAENPTRALDLMKVRKFFEWIEQNQERYSLEEILKRAALHKELEIPIFPDPIPADKDSIQILTAHRAKGSEFDVVFIPGLLEKVWGSRRTRTGIALPQVFHTAHNQDEEERRLFYVALTRARKHLILSYSMQDFSGRDRSPSLFWHEVPDALCQEVPVDVAETKAQEILPALFAVRDTPQLTHTEQEILHRRVAQFTWSATSLQDYLDCPRKFLFVHLLRFPSKPNKHMALGIALHRALETFLTTFRDTKNLPDIESLLRNFQTHLQSRALPRTEFTDALAHGQEILRGYMEHCQGSFPQSVLLEQSLEAKLEGISIRGNLDRIELSEDKKTAILVDYKSGKPKPIKPSERIWRQMVFYDLLARGAEVSWVPTGGAIEFLTPDPRRGYVREELHITDEDCQMVLEELQRSHQAVSNLEFPFVENPKNDSDIEHWQSFDLFGE